MFIQIEPSAFQDVMQGLNTRHDIEQKIDEALKAKGLGRWTAGDMGAGGANMTFEIVDTDNALSLILEVLSKAGLDNNAIIARRTNTDTENWFYEVLYPQKYTGVFNTM